MRIYLLQHTDKDDDGFVSLRSIHESAQAAQAAFLVEAGNFGLQPKAATHYFNIEVWDTGTGQYVAEAPLFPDDGVETNWKDISLQIDGIMNALGSLKEFLNEMPERKLAEAEPEVYAELQRLRAEIKGPAGFATWKDAALAERIARVELERKAGQDIDYLTAMAVFEPSVWEKMGPIGGYMQGWNARGRSLLKG